MENNDDDVRMYRVKHCTIVHFLLLMLTSFFRSRVGGKARSYSENYRQDNFVASGE